MKQSQLSRGHWQSDDIICCALSPTERNFTALQVESKWIKHVFAHRDPLDTEDNKIFDKQSKWCSRKAKNSKFEPSRPYKNSQLIQTRQQYDKF